MKLLSLSDKVRILNGAASAAIELQSGTTKCHSFASLVQHYTGRKYSIEQIDQVLFDSSSIWKEVWVEFKEHGH